MVNQRQGLELRQGQNLVLTPALRQSISILQLSATDLAAEIDREINENPVLELENSSQNSGENGSSNGDSGQYLTSNSFSSSTKSNNKEYDFDATDNIEDNINLNDYLDKQLHMAFKNEWEREIGKHIINSIDESGYLKEDLEKIAQKFGTSTYKVEKILNRMQEFEPVGIFSRNLEELLTINLKDRELFNDKTELVVKNIDLLAQLKYDELAKICKTTPEAIIAIHKVIKTINPKPTAGFANESIVSIIPDVLMTKNETGEWKLEINPNTIPKLLVNQNYKVQLKGDKISKKDKEYLSEKLQSANNLIRAIDMRKKTILKIASEIVNVQKKYFETGNELDLGPLQLSDISKKIDMHNSTVSRASAHKFISTPHGILPFKYFFSKDLSDKNGNGKSGLVSQRKIKKIIRDLISEEGKGKALKDPKIVSALEEKGYFIKRRTVAKYREEMGLPTFGIRNRAKEIGY